MESKSFSRTLNELIGQNRLQFITANDLQPFAKLTHLYLYNNELRSLDGDLFKHTFTITVINFSNNPIAEVGYGLLDGLTQLKLASFEECQCINYNANKYEKVEILKNYLRINCEPMAITTKRLCK